MPVSRDEKIRGELENEKASFIKELGSRIRSIRVHNDLSQAEFAAALRISMKSLSKIENGEKQPSGRLLGVLESYFAVNGVWLITGKGEMLEGESRPMKIENDERFLRMFNRLNQDGKEKIVNILKMFMKAEYINRLEMDEGIVADVKIKRKISADSFAFQQRGPHED